jgi:hypothetical protein
MQRFKTINWDSVHTFYQYLTDWDNETIHEDRSIEKHVDHRLAIFLTDSNFVGFSNFYDCPAIRIYKTRKLNHVSILCLHTFGRIIASFNPNLLNDNCPVRFLIIGEDCTAVYNFR